MDVPLFLAGLLAFIAASVHGVGGERIVLRKLWEGPLPRTRFGGPASTRSMVHVTWHITSFAFLAAGVAMVVSAVILEGDAADALALFSAASFTGFAAIAVVLGSAGQPGRALMRHPGPAALAITAGLAWWGAF